MAKQRRTLPSTAAEPAPVPTQAVAQVAPAPAASWGECRPLLTWDFENVFSDKAISFAAGVSAHPQELSGLVGQTGGGPAEVLGEHGTAFVTRFLGRNDMFVWVTTTRPLFVEALRFRHWHNHNPEFPTYGGYQVRLRIDSGSGYRAVGEPLSLSDDNSGHTDAMPLGVTLAAGKHRIGWRPLGLRFGGDTNTEYFAIKDLQLLGRWADAADASELGPRDELPPDGGLGFVTAVVEDNQLVRYDVRGLFTGPPTHSGGYDWEYNSWRLTEPGSRVTFPFERPSDATGLAVGVVWAGWGDDTRVRVLVNGRPLVDDHAVHGSAWGNPMRDTFPIPIQLLRKSNTVTLELREDSPMVLFFQSISLKRV